MVRAYFLLLILNLLIILENQPLREDIVGDDYDHVINDFNDKLAHWILEAEDGNPDEGDDNINHQGQCPVEEEAQHFDEEVADRGVVGAKDPHLVGKVGDQDGDEPGNYVRQLVIPVNSGTQNLKDSQVDNSCHNAPEEVSDDVLILFPELLNH